MADRSEVDPDQMHERSKGFAEVGQRMRGIANDFTKITDVDPSWFEGEIGEEFKKNFSPARDDIMKALHALSEALTGIGDGVRSMAKGYAGADQFAKDAGHQLGGLMQQTPSSSSAAGQPGTGGSGRHT
ncbi:WXG100 family type VII secretion target [Streptomyces sp. 8N616]|uniref:WXG100 family type VII secretion target n=1 Tax=Streptomyces sp. 8N616 TaxID=3457414 RepID=UPI003FCF1F3B